MSLSVIDCSERRDGLFLITYRSTGSREVKSALSQNSIDPGATIALRSMAGDPTQTFAVRTK